jgi:hypothetical protein
MTFFLVGTHFFPFDRVKMGAVESAARGDLAEVIERMEEERDEQGRISTHMLEARTGGEGVSSMTV